MTIIIILTGLNSNISSPLSLHNQPHFLFIILFYYFTPHAFITLVNSTRHPPSNR
ncbi:hypothetical protein CGRA01v4_10492 [Colletotrichum graminicola]|nr:hypothetical protein CGRA01v4_10492 [Colletotrichum graminicola]